MFSVVRTKLAMSLHIYILQLTYQQVTQEASAITIFRFNRKLYLLVLTTPKATIQYYLFYLSLARPDPLEDSNSILVTIQNKLIQLGSITIIKVSETRLLRNVSSVYDLTFCSICSIIKLHENTLN